MSAYDRAGGGMLVGGNRAVPVDSMAKVSLGEPRRPEIAALLDEQEGAVIDLQQVAAMLAERLTPIMRDAEPSQCADDCRRSPDTHIGSRILEMTTRTRSAEGILRDLLNRLEV